MSANGKYGARFAGGYQFPRTDAASLKREAAILSERNLGTSRATLELVPLTGGRRVLFDLCARWEGMKTMEVDRNADGPVYAAIPTSQAWSFLIEDGEENARRAFKEVAEGFRRGHFPEMLP